ncbi:MAG: ABC transporter ATP-binding protein [Desulfobacterota bacterium]|nr:ABC transporter ATP-binding protein [Thermodesulfobacteriota bacterium]
MATSAISLHDVSKSFQKLLLRGDHGTVKTWLLKPLALPAKPRGERFEVFSHLDLEIPRGISLGVIGRNGSGKSTLLKLLAGIYKPDGGTIQLEGRVASLIELGAGFHPEFTGRENVFINGAVMGLSRKEIEARFDRIVRFAELESFIDAPVRTYSSGMYVRLGFSVAVNVDPDILLVDEVLAVGDESFSHKCLDQMIAFKKAGKTIVLVTHDLPTVERFCEEAVWLDGGCLRAQGPPRQVVDAYRQEVARREEARFQDERPEDQCPAPAGLLSKDRWGNGDLEIIRVRILDDQGQDRHVFQSGEDITIELAYRVHRPTADVVFGVGIFNGEGACAYGTNTETDRIVLPALGSQGRIGFLLEKPQFIEGTYFLDVAVHARDGHAYDYQSRCVSLAVRSSLKDTGLYRVPHRWLLPDGTK